MIKRQVSLLLNLLWWNLHYRSTESWMQYTVEMREDLVVLMIVFWLRLNEFSRVAWYIGRKRWFSLNFQDVTNQKAATTLALAFWGIPMQLSWKMKLSRTNMRLLYVHANSRIILIYFWLISQRLFATLYDLTYI